MLKGWDSALRRAGSTFPAFAAALVVAFAVAACVPKPVKPAPPAGPPTYDKVLAGYNAAVASGEASTRGKMEGAMIPLDLVAVYTERARLTGGYDDYSRAEDLLSRIETQFGTSDGLCLAKARLDYTLHRLARAKQVLDACPRIAGQAEDLGLRADIAFYSGRYKDAGIIYRALVNQTGTPQSYAQLALYAAKMGQPGEALAFMEAAEKRYYGDSAIQKSWFALQRGLIELDRGRYDEARALFTLADQRMPGYWLNQEHLAEVARLRGDAPAARKIYEDVVRKTGAPEYLDALASIENEAGQAAAVKQLIERAEGIYDQRAKRFPEAIAGHALTHYLSVAPQPAKALQIAEANFENRPYGDAAIALAKAYLLNRRAQEARRLLDAEIAKGWDTAETYWIMSLAAKASGDQRDAAKAAEEATRRNPHSASQYAFNF